MQLDASPQIESRRTVREELECGVLHLDLSREVVPIEELVGFASRINPARRYSFVSRVIGKHIPTRPEQIRNVARLLADRIPKLEGPVLFIGLAEMGVTLGQSVFDAWLEISGSEGLYIDSTRTSVAGCEFFRFSEEHSHASAHRIHLPKLPDALRIFESADSIVLVDDEVTTGRTAENLIRAITNKRGTPPSTAVIASPVSWAEPEWLHSVNLAAGEMQFTENHLAERTPPICDSEAPISIPEHFAGSRTGLLAPETLPENLAIEVTPRGRHLVVGTGELGFLPLKVAEQIEYEGGIALLQSTSRSPLHLGNAIGHRREFPSLAGGTWREFLYNVPDNHGYDSVILCIEETDQLSSEHPLRTVSGLQIIALPR